MKPTRRPRSVVLVVTSVLLVWLVGAGSGSSALQPSPDGRFPSIRLLGTEREVSDVRPAGWPVVIELHTFVASVGGDFVVQASTRSDGTIVASQLSRSTSGEITGRRRLPTWAVSDLTQGLDGFFRVTVRDEQGEEVESTDVPFCPAAWDRSRVDDTGPAVSAFIYGCWASELTRGMTWGIDAGWAARAPDSWLVQIDIPDGTYRLDVEIAEKYRKLFRVPRDQARVNLTLIVTTGDEIDGDDAAPPDGSALPDPHASGERGTLPAEVTAAADGLPDLIALPPFNITIAGPDDPAAQDGDGLIFGANVWNGGDGPLVVEGFRRLGEPVMDAYQYFYEDGKNIGRELVGELEFDEQPGHRHWHFTDFAEYSLTDLQGNEVARSGKEAFCLAPTDPIDLTLENANFNPYGGLATSCGFFGAMWIREILDVGWGDTYYQSVPGQWIEITDVPNGEYLLKVATNQDGRLDELRSDNNVAHTRIALGGRAGARTVEVVPDS